MCRSLEHRTRDCEERRAEKGAILAKIDVTANAEVGLVSAMTGAAREDGKEEWYSGSGTSFPMSHTQAEMTAYTKAPVRKTVEVADRTILPIDGFGTVEVDLDQPDTTTKPVEIVLVAYVPGLSRSLLSTREAVEQWGKPLVYYETRLFWGSRGRSRLFLTSAPTRDCFAQ